MVLEEAKEEHVTALDIQVTPLDELDLDASPPCAGQTLLVTRTRWRRRYKITGRIQCTRPAASRVKTTCPGCGHVDRQFLCASCTEDARRGTLACAYCLRVEGKLNNLRSEMS